VSSLGRTVFRRFAFAARFAGLLLVGLLAALECRAQYPGQVAKSAKDSPTLRSIAVLEWTGEAGKPKASRIVPVTVLDGGQLQDGGIYLARPQPLAVSGGVEYELQQNGKAVGLFDVQNAGQVQGSWVGFGSWKPLPVVKPKASMQELAKIDTQDAESDRPTLHRKKHADDGKDGKPDSSDSGSAEPAGADDPDRPKLHKKDSSGSDNAGSGSASDADRPTLHKKTGDDSSASSQQADDPDRPTLHKKTGDNAGDTSAAGSATTETTDDPDRPKLKKGKKAKPAEDIGHAESLPDVTDPDRPKLKRGKATGDSLEVAPSLMGMPADLQQAVAVSDAKSRPEHPWSYSWANAEDEAKMKSALEDIARDALGLKAPPAPKPVARRGTTRTAATRKTAKPVAPVPAPEPPPLEAEEFRVFELAYGSGATMVLTAHTSGPQAQQKFVTLVAQPDLYGNVLVLLKNVTDGAHLDEKPRMRLVDAVDVMADNRGELLFELRGDTQRQFAVYRVLRGQAEKLFAGGGGEYGVASNQ
jgi:hypothetical protein